MLICLHILVTAESEIFDDVGLASKISDSAVTSIYTQATSEIGQWAELKFFLSPKLSFGPKKKLVEFMFYEKGFYGK